MKYKIGDKVKYINNDGVFPLNSIHTITKIGESGVLYYLDDCYWVHELTITLAEKSWDTLAVGDIIVDTDEMEALIIDAFPNSFVRSDWGNFETVNCIYSKKEAQTAGWTIKGAVTETVKEMTLEDIEKLVGSKVKIIK